MSTDTLSHLNQAKGAGPITDLQPVIQSLVWKVLITITGTISSLFILQVFLLWFALFLLSIFVWDKTKNALLSLLPLSVGFLPNVINISGVVWSDNQMAFSLLLVVAILLNYDYVKNKWIKRIALAATFLLIFYAGLVRYNAILAVIPIVFLSVYKLRFFKRKLYSILAALGMIVFIILSTFIVKLAFTQRHITNTAGPMMDDIVHVLSAQDINNRPIAQPVKQSLINIKKCTEEKGIVVDSFPCGVEQDKTNIIVLYTSDVASTWRWGVSHKPLSYLEYKAEVFLYVLFPPQGRGYIWQEGIEPNNFNLSPKFPSLGNANHAYVFNFGYKHFQSFYEPWLWLFLSIALIYYSVRYLKKTKTFVFALNLSAFMHILSFIPTGVAADYRYIIWPVLATTSSIILILTEKKLAIFKDR
jgi:hypothetical protein